jgi:hypothetical protein
MVMALLLHRRCLGQWVRRLVVLGFLISIQQREGAKVWLLRAKAKGTASADVALLLGAVVELLDLLLSRATFSGESLDLAMQGRTMASMHVTFPSKGVVL